MGSKYNVATCVEELGSTISYWRSKRLSKRVKCQTWPRQPNRSCWLLRSGGKGHPFLQFQYMPKGSPWGPNTMLQCAEKNWVAPQYTGGANVIQRGPECQTWPRQPNRSRLSPARGGKGHPFLQHMSKGSLWILNTLLHRG